MRRIFNILVFVFFPIDHLFLIAGKTQIKDKHIATTQILGSFITTLLWYWFSNYNPKVILMMTLTIWILGLFMWITALRKTVKETVQGQTNLKTILVIFTLTFLSILSSGMIWGGILGWLLLR